jgi:putative membrane protein
MENFMESFGGSGSFALYFLVSLALLVVFVLLYSVITPYREFKLIRAGNKAAALSLGGAIIGFAIPVGKAVAQSVNFTDMLVWAGIAFLAQLIAYLAAALCVPHFRKTIAEDHVASGILLAALSVAIGILNAASMTL